jgi:hypothetical protein
MIRRHSSVFLSYIMQIKDLQEAYFHFSENQNELKSSELFRPIQYILNLKSKR